MQRATLSPFFHFRCFPLFLQRLHTTLCWQSWSGELPGTHVRALSSLAEYRNCHELPGLSCMQLLLEQPYSLMTYFQILLDNRRVRGGLVRRLKVKVQRKAIQNLNYVLCDHPAPCVDITKHNSSPGLYRLLYCVIITIFWHIWKNIFCFLIGRSIVSPPENCREQM